MEGKAATPRQMQKTPDHSASILQAANSETYKQLV